MDTAVSCYSRLEQVPRIKANSGWITLPNWLADILDLELASTQWKPQGMWNLLAES